RLTLMVQPENAVRNLPHAHVYLDESNPKATLATDLLLGTQGWRRFINAGTGFINGAVTDSSGARIPGVTVRAMNTDTGETVEGITNETGAYVFPSVGAGTYQVSASLPGFQTETVTGLRVPFNSNVRQDLRLKVAVVNAMVEVAVPVNGRIAVPQAFFGGVLGAMLPGVPGD